MTISTSILNDNYVPWIFLKHYDVKFRGKEIGVNGPNGMKIASESGYIVLNNGRQLNGAVEIKANPPF